MQYATKSLETPVSTDLTQKVLTAAKYGLFMSFFPGIYVIGQFFFA